MIKINIEAFAILRDFFGKEFLEYEVPEGTTAQELLKLIAESYPVSYTHLTLPTTTIV